MVRMITAAAVLTIAGSAMAVPTGAHWEMVDNSTTAGPSGPNGFELSWMTFDLFVDLAAGDSITAVDFGIAGPNTGLSTDGTTFHVPAPFGGDSFQTNTGFFGFVDNLEYDTSVALGTESLSFAGAGVIDWSPAGFNGAWFSSVSGNAVAGPSVFVARITVSAATTFLGGELFVSGNGPGGEFGGQDPATGVVAVPNAKIPTPGALALFGLAGAAATRRRR